MSLSCRTCVHHAKSAGQHPCDSCRNHCHHIPLRTPDVLVIPPASAPLGTKDTNPKDSIGVRKAPVSTLPAGVMLEVGTAMLEGATKYGRHNYRVHGVRASVYYDASVGHLMDWWEGEDIDPDSGLSHVTKAIASLMVLRDAMLQGKLTDDRPPRSKVHKRDFNDTAAAILDRNAHLSPHHCTLADDQPIG